MTRHSTASGAHFAFTDRWGGVSAAPYAELNLGGTGDPAIAENRALAAKELGLDPADVVWMNQVHSAEVALANAPFGPDAPAVDGVVTARRDLALAVQTADCTPVLLADTEAGVAGAAHAGRLGVQNGVVAETVRRMVELGAEPGRLVARTGPAICGGCYEVPASVREEVAARVPAVAATTRWGTPSVDMAAGVRAQLRSAGVTTLEQSSVCTRESSDHYSYRRDGTSGRLASYVWIEGS
ncbi:peptidoglycan editing factor PgeF [Streptomyces sulphureus]|uniref:peptidoglycan editing factor PgeF n=1 Tax=Streptomyces sulphureus TaxID=47758 RepID=UPI00099600FF|nr:peptidoglycan editing factor PgeF [Streptomyces sulphureus]